jgi:ParB family chromosome partitioning protein
MGLVAGNMMSETNEWYTPEHYIASVRAVLGCIDLDPASCETANAVVQAAEFFTEADDGLKRAWHGRVFMNPPYGVDKGESRAANFCNKAITEYRAGRVTEAIILVNSVHSQKWQRPLYDFPVCFVDHRIEFCDQHGEVNPNPTFANIFVYLGQHEDRFAEEFEKHGYCMRRIKNGHHGSIQPLDGR